MNESSGPTVFGMFVKEPVANRVKTRLAARLGEDGGQLAANLYAAFQSDLVEKFGSHFDRRVMGFAPSSAIEFFTELSAGQYQLWAQPELELGQRMKSFFEMAFASGAGRVVLIGSDSPTLPVHVVERAFESLLTNDLVLVPATDGGYVLIGQSGMTRDVFDGIEWSCPTVLADTVKIAQEKSMSVGVLDPWYDVDTVDGLRMLTGHIAAMDVGRTGQALIATRAALDDLELPAE